MRRGAKRDKHMPNGMVERVLLVFVKEIRTNCIKDAFCKDSSKGGVRQMHPKRIENEQRHPTHGEVES